MRCSPSYAPAVIRGIREPARRASRSFQLSDRSQHRSRRAKASHCIHGECFVLKLARPSRIRRLPARSSSRRPPTFCIGGIGLSAVRLAPAKAMAFANAGEGLCVPESAPFRRQFAAGEVPHSKTTNQGQPTCRPRTFEKAF
jgi:hypothetical protein